MKTETSISSKTTKTIGRNSQPSKDFDDVMSRLRRAEEYSAGWHDNVRRWRLLYDMKHYNRKTEAGIIHYNDPTYTNTVDLSVGIMLGNDLQFHAYGLKPTPDEQKNTGAIEKLLLGVISANNEKEESHQLYNLFLNFNRDGGGCIYCPFDGDIEAELEDYSNAEGNTSPAYTFKEIPFVMKIVDPLDVIFLPGGNRKWLMIGRKDRRSVLDMEIEYNVKFDQYPESQEVKSGIYDIFYDLWDYIWEKGEDGKQELKVRNTIIFAGKPIMGPRIMDGYEELPYTIQFFNPTGKDPSKWHSILTPLESSVMMLERTFNRRAKQIDIFTALPLIVKTQPGRGADIDTSLYNSIQVSPDESIEFAKWPGNPPEVQMQVEFLRTRIQQSGFSDVMFGSGTSQIAGYALSQLGDQNRIRLQQPIKHLELLLTAWAKKILKLLDVFAEGTVVYVYGRNKGEDYIDRVNVDNLRGYSVRAEIRPNFPNEEMRKVAMSTQVKGTVSDYTRMEKYLGIEQPEDEYEKKIIEATYNHPLMIKYGIMAKLRKMAEDDPIARMVLASEMNSQASNPAGRPADENEAEQLTGTQSPTGQPVPQAVSGENPGESPLDQAENMANAAPDMSGGM